MSRVFLKAGTVSAFVIPAVEPGHSSIRLNAADALLQHHHHWSIDSWYVF